MVRRRLRVVRRTAPSAVALPRPHPHRRRVDFGILYEDEWNAGNDVRRVGEEGLFELLVEHNIAAFDKADFHEVFTTDPHSFNTLRNEYPSYGLDKPVKHYTELLAELLESGAIAAQPLGAKVTYHDPCYLARYKPPDRRAAPGARCARMRAGRDAAQSREHLLLRGPAVDGSGWTTRD